MQACQVLRQPRATQRHLPKNRDDEKPLTRRIIELASIFGRYGYRRITALLRLDSWWVNHKRGEQIWRREGLKVPKKPPGRGRLWFNDGSCIRLRPNPRPCVGLRFRAGPTHEGCNLRMLTLWVLMTYKLSLPPSASGQAYLGRFRMDVARCQSPTRSGASVTQ